ncbi:hypothetical protein OQA88_1196 [Cercophora sp. LCS_1]
MSGLEPLAALGLACNVFQVLSFAGDLCKIYRDIRERGQVPELATPLAGTSESLTKAFNDAEAIAANATQQLTESEQELLKVARDCQKAVKSLQDGFSSPKTTAGAKGNMIQSFTTALQVVKNSRKSKVKELEKLVERHRIALETRLLVNICTKAEAIQISQCDGFDNLDSALRSFILSFSQGNTRLEHLLVRETASIKDHITNAIAPVALESTLQELQTDSTTAHHNIRQAIKDTHDSHEAANTKAAKKSRHDQLLGSLRYPTMNERRNQIKYPHCKTFEWIFCDHRMSDRKDSNVQRRERVQHNLRVRAASDKFCEWLQSPDSKLFWVCGKPGSGKSTFMKFVADDSRTLALLNRTDGISSSGGFRIASHFIWSSGVSLEAKIKGLLCSLVFQLLVSSSDPKNPYFISELVLTEFPTFRLMAFNSDWSEQQLKDLLFRLVRLQACQAHCFFIDGLDEIDPSDGQPQLVELLDEMQSLPRLKLCVSSRPEHTLHNYLDSFPTFKIQDLTYMDIWNFASHTLRNEFSSVTIFSEEIVRSDDEKKKYQGLVRKICSMAEGVFLWVTLALRSLQRGFQGKDSFQELQNRLQKLPKDLKALYKQMWSRLGDDEEMYRTDAATYLNIVLAMEVVRNEAPAWFEQGDDDFALLLAKNTRLTNEILRYGQEFRFTRGQDLQKMRDETIHHVKTRCAGLLEVIPAHYLGYRIPSFVIRFVHRSARDFVTDDPDGRQLLAHDETTTQQHCYNTVKAWLAKDTLSSVLVGFHHGITGFRRPSTGLQMVNRLLKGGKITREHASQFLALMDSLLPRSIATSTWGRKTDGCLEHVDLLGLLAQEGATELFQEALQRKKRGNPELQLSPAYMSFLFIQTATKNRSPVSDECLNMGDWLVQKAASVDLGLRTLPCICDIGRSSFVPFSALSSTVAKLCQVPRMKPEQQKRLLATINTLLHQDGVAVALSAPMILEIKPWKEPPFGSLSNVPLTFLSLFGFSLRDIVFFEARTKFVLQYILRFAFKQGEHAKLRLEVDTILDAVRTDGPEIERMMIFRPGGKIAEISGLLCTTNDTAHLSELESYLRKEALDGVPTHVVHKEFPQTGVSRSIGLDELVNRVASDAKEWETIREAEKRLVERDIMWRRDDPRLRVPEMWA